MGALLFILGVSVLPCDGLMNSFFVQCLLAGLHDISKFFLFLSIVGMNQCESRTLTA